MEKNINIEIFLTRISEGIKQILRGQEIQARRLDNLDTDRQILENICSRLLAVEEQVKLSRQHDSETTKDIKFEINEVKGNVEEKIDEIGEQLSQKKVVTIKKYPKWMFWKKQF